MVLQQAGGRRGVIFGVTVSGRPEDLPGAEEVIGLFFNDLPLRIDVDPARGVADLARDVQRSFSELRRRGYLSTSDIRAAAAIPEEEELFQTLLVFENYPKEQEMELRRDRSERLRNVSAWRREVSDIDMTVYVEATDRIAVEIRYRSDAFDAGTVRELLHDYERALSHIAAVS
jgi:non-ribosomal peptide synthetase component F